MKTILKRSTCALLVALIAAGAFACGDSDKKSPSDSTDMNTESMVVKPQYAPESLDLGGRQFNIMLRSTSWTPTDIWSEGINGEIMNDAVYKRNLGIQDMYNVKLNATIPNEATGNDLNTYVQSFVMAGENPYDLLLIRVSDAAKLAQTGIFSDLLNLKALDFNEAGWQYDKLMETVIGGKLFYATGLITNAANALNVCFFNKKIAEENKVGNLYELTKSGKFTYDVLNNAAKLSSRDIDGNGVMDINDQYGVSAQGESSVRMLYTSSGEAIITKDSNDYPRIVIGSERSINVSDKITKLLSDKNSVFIGATNDMKSVWFGERALFYFASLSNANAMRDYDFEFGLLPFPKYDEAQEEYYCYLNAHNPCGAVIPNTANADESAAILQALQFYSQSEVIPAYYDTCLKGKQIRDNDSIEMLDIIFESWKSDLSDAYAFSNIASTVAVAILKGTGITSAIDSVRSAAEASIEACVKTFEEIK